MIKKFFKNKMNFENIDANLKLILEDYGEKLKILYQKLKKEDNLTFEHSLRVVFMVKEFLQYLKEKDDQKRFDLDFILKKLDAFLLAVFFHDIGKLDSEIKRLINLERVLSKEEKEILRQHPIIGAEMVRKEIEVYDESIASFICEIIKHHHERWNGKGYPDKLKGDNIPFGSRILAILDNYDALRSKRPYKSAFEKDKALEIMQDNSDWFDFYLLEQFILFIQDFDDNILYDNSSH